MKPVAVAIFCKTPSPGFSKTRLSPPLRPEDCSLLSSCFIQDLTATIAEATSDGAGTPFAVYTPAGSETSLRALLPAGFQLLLQCEGDFGTRLSKAVLDLLDDGHAGAILLNSDSPTLPTEILKAAIAAVRSCAGHARIPAAAPGGKGFDLVWHRRHLTCAASHQHRAKRSGLQQWVSPCAPSSDWRRGSSVPMTSQSSFRSWQPRV